MYKIKTKRCGMFDETIIHQKPNKDTVAPFPWGTDCLEYTFFFKSPELRY